MDLLYLFLDNFKNLTQQGFPFNGEFVFKTHVKDNHIELQISMNPDYVPNFFGNENIQQITAIIGQNGSGKSNVLDFIKTKLAYGAGGFDKEAIIIYRKQDRAEFPLEYIVLATPKLDVRVVDRTNKGFKLQWVQPIQVHGPLRTLYGVDDFDDLSVIYYSNIVDLKIPSSLTNSKIEFEEEPTSVTGCVNISTMAMLSADQQNYSLDNQKVEKVDAYKAREFGRNIEFIISNHRKLLPFDLPETLYAYILNEDERAAQYMDELKWVHDLLKRFEVDLSPEQRSVPMGFLYMLSKSALYNMLIFNIEYKQFRRDREFFLTVQAPTIFEYMMALLSKMIDDQKQNPSISLMKQKASAMKEFLNYVYEYLIANNSSVHFSDEYVFAIPISVDNELRIKKFIDYYVEAKGLTDFLNFKFRNLSSGEQSMLTTISRFYKISIDPNLGLKKKLLLLIDEGDVYYHPEWQRTFLDVLLGYLAVLWPDKQFQIIFTSNTPYLASDLPDYDVIRLHHKKQKIVVSQDNPLAKKTFGANIHTLLSDSFYVTNFMGEFAKKKIEALASFLQSNKSKNGDLNRETAQKVINLIGEPIIRNRLQDMFDEKYQIPNEDIRDRRDWLKRELDELNKLIEEE